MKDPIFPSSSCIVTSCPHVPVIVAVVESPLGLGIASGSHSCSLSRIGSKIRILLDHKESLWLPLLVLGSLYTILVCNALTNLSYLRGFSISLISSVVSPSTASFDAFFSKICQKMSYANFLSLIAQNQLTSWLVLSIIRIKYRYRIQYLRWYII